MDNFAEQRFSLVASFLDFPDLARCQLVSRSWWRVHRDLLPSRLDREWQDLFQETSEKCEERHAARQNLSTESRFEMDKKVAFLTVSMFWKRYFYPQRKTLFEELAACLQQGGLIGTDSQQANPRGRERVRKFMDLIQDPERSTDEKLLALQVWQELIPANFETMLLEWFVQWVVKGRHGHARATFPERWQAWKFVRLVFVTQKHQLRDQAQLVYFCQANLSIIMSKGEALLENPLDLWFAKHYVQFMVAHLGFMLMPNACLSFRVHYLWFLGMDEDKEIPFALLQLCIDWEAVFRSVWSTRGLQRYFRQHLGRLAWLVRLFLRKPELLSYLCQRKDRQTFELLFQVEPFVMVHEGLACALDLLSVSTGKTERLQGYLESIQRAAQQKDDVQQELRMLRRFSDGSWKPAH